MDIYNPVSFFYYSSCIRLDDDKTELYHSILESLTRIKSTNNEILYAIKNIILADTPFQIYCFSYAIEQIGKLKRNNYYQEEIIPKYIKIFPPLFNDKIQNTIQELLNNIAGISKIDNLHLKLLKLIEHVYSDDILTYESNSKTPYIDIVEYSAQSIVLSILNYYCNEKQIVNSLNDTIEKNADSPLHLLIENSIKHKYGRLCFLLGISLKKKLMLLNSNKDFFDTIWRSKNIINCPDLEPDVVFLFLETWFHHFNLSLNEDQRAEKIFEELRTLKLYEKCNLIFNFVYKKEEYYHNNYKKYLSLIFGKNTIDFVKDRMKISVNIWIGSIYLVISEYFDNNVASQHLNCLWRPILEGDTGIAYNSDYITLNEYITHTINEKLPKRTIKRNNNLAILSPWLCVDTSPIENRYQKDARNYKGYDCFHNWIRILYAVCVSKNVLMKSQNIEKHDLFYCFLIHVSELLLYARDILEIKQPNPNHYLNKRLYFLFNKKPNIRKILLQIKRDINLPISSGKLYGMSHNSFLSLFKKEKYSENNFEYFWRDILPDVLFKWIYDSSHSGIQLSEINEEKSKYSILENHISKTLNKNKLKIIRKYLLGEEISSYDKNSSWSESILLYDKDDMRNTNRINVEEWFTIKQSDLKYFSEKQKFLSVAIQRYKYKIDIIKGGFENTKNSLIEILKSIRDSNEISYPNRFALLSILDDIENINQSDYEVIKLSLDILFEIGGLLDISLICEKLLTKVIVMDSQKINKYHLILLNDLSSSITTSLKLNLHDKNNPNIPNDPWLSIVNEGKINYLRNALNILQYIAIKYKWAIGDRLKIYNYGNEYLENNFNIFENDVSVKDDKPIFDYGKKIINPLLSLITYNRIAQTSQLYNKIIDKDTLNLFSLNENEKSVLFNPKKKKHKIIGICVDKILDNGDFKYAILVDHKIIKYVKFVNNELEIGNISEVKSFFIERNGNWAIDNKYCKKLFGYELMRNELYFSDINAIKISKLNWDYWLPCYSDIFTGYINSSLPIKVGLNKDFRPVEGTFIELIKEMKSKDDLIVLTFVDVKWDASRHENRYCFYKTFGKNYVIYESEIISEYSNITFSDYLYNEVINKDNIGEDPNGLIISFCLNVKGINVYLKLCRNEKILNDEITLRYPYLEMPFDKRNILWKSLFNDAEDNEYIAVNENNKWIYKTDDYWVKRKFPHNIIVDIEPNNYNEDEIDFFVDKEWGRDGGRFNIKIGGKPVQRIKINKNQLKKYLSLKVNDEFILNYMPSINKKTASFICFNKDNIKASIDLEELFLSPKNINDININSQIYNRKFIINKIKDWTESSTPLEVLNFVPPVKYVRNNEIIGYFTNVPRRNDKNVSSFSVILENIDGLSPEIDLNIENVNKLNENINVYTKFRGELCDGSWIFYCCPRSIFLKTTWKLTELIKNNFPNNIYYIGNGKIENKNVFLYEDFNKNGLLYYCYSLSDNKINNDLFEDEGQISTNWIPQALGNNKKRIGFLRKSRLVTGNIYDLIPDTKYFNIWIQKIAYNIKKFVDSDYLINRTFKIDIVEKQKIKKAEDALISSEKEKEECLKSINEYFLNDCVKLDGIFDKEKLEVKILSSQKLKRIIKNGVLTDKVSLINGENNHLSDLVFVPAVMSKYSTNKVYFWLQRDINGEIFASFKYGSFGIEDLFSEYGVETDKIFNVSNNKIYFVDKENEHPITKESHSNEMYRFEAGFGRNYLIPSDQIRWCGKQIKKSDFILYHSDAITKFNFYYERNRGNEILILNIIDIEICQAKELYLQAKTKTYHLAYIRLIDNIINIKYVRGYDKRSLKENSMSKIYDRIFATFDDISVNNLKSLFINSLDTNEKVVLVKVDTIYFEKYGKLRFNYFKLTFNKNEKDSYVRTVEDGAKIIMILGSIGRTSSGNDYYINLEPYSSLNKRDIGSDFQNGRILRRAFSKNEAMLREYYLRHDRKSFEGYEVYVSVFKNKGDNNNVTFSLVNNNLIRSGRILKGLRNKSNIIGIAKKDSTLIDNLVLEVKPGNFIEIENKYLKFSNIDKINEGDVLDIIVKEDYYEVVNCIAGDYRYAINNRKVVILPKDSKDDLVPINKDYCLQSFTIGGLPNVELGFEKISNDKVTELLTKHHPKIACISRRSDKVYLKLHSNYNYAIDGIFLVDNVNNKIIFEDSNKIKYPVLWSKLSFFNESAVEIINRILMCKWKYHDTKSKNLIKHGNDFIYGEAYEMLSNALTENDKSYPGPVFCNIGKDRKVDFRYTNNLFFWGYPVSSLIEFLDYIGKEYKFAYVGVQENIHFIEIAPGRIVELPVNILYLKINGIEISMKNYAWDILSVGDEITLKNIVGDFTDVYKIELISINHNFKNVVIDSIKTVVREVDLENGFIGIGPSNDVMKYPISKDEKIIVKDELIDFRIKYNKIINNGSGLTIENNDTVLLYLKNDDFYIKGYDKLRPGCLDSNEINIIRSILKKSNNEIPVQIVREKNQRKIYFKRPLIAEKKDLINGKILQGEIVNSLKDNCNEIIIRIGGYYEILPFEEVIGGVDIKYRPFVIKSLIGKSVWIMIKYDNKHNFEIVCGVCDDLISEIYVCNENYVYGNENELLGAVCRSIYTQKLYWMPINEMAWCNITMENVDYVFYNYNENTKNNNCSVIKVALCQNNNGKYISRIKVNELVNAFKRKRCGFDSLEIAVISELKKIKENQYGFTGLSFLYKTIVDCVTYQEVLFGKLEKREIVKVNVYEKDNLNIKLKAYWGDKRILIHFPYYKYKLTHKYFKVRGNSNVIDDFCNLNFIELPEISMEKINNAIDYLYSTKIENMDIVFGFKILKFFIVAYLQKNTSELKYIIDKLISLLKLNLIRNISTETINSREPYKFHEQYLDLLLRDTLYSFVDKENIYLSEYEYKKFKRTALLLCFQNQDSRYSAIGNAMLQLIGIKSYLDPNIINKSVLFDVSNKLEALKYQVKKGDKEKSIALISMLVKTLEINHIHFNLVDEKII